MAHVTLSPQIHSELTRSVEKLNSEGNLLSERQLSLYAQVFEEKFGSEQLSRLDDEALLERLHRAPKDSLVYWLEFKNDDEFATTRLGSISGGSALKFNIFYQQSRGRWMGRAPNTVGTPVEITPEEALKWARKHRDQLLSGVEVLRKLPTPVSDHDYQKLQADMDSVAPDVSNLAWGHKLWFAKMHLKLKLTLPNR